MCALKDICLFINKFACLFLIKINCIAIAGLFWFSFLFLFISFVFRMASQKVLVPDITKQLVVYVPTEEEVTQIADFLKENEAKTEDDRIPLNKPDLFLWEVCAWWCTSACLHVLVCACWCSCVCLYVLIICSSVRVHECVCDNYNLIVIN